MKVFYFIIMFVTILIGHSSASINSEASDYYLNFNKILSTNPSKEELEKINKDVNILINSDKIDPKLQILLKGKLLEVKRRLKQINIGDYIDFQKTIDSNYLLPEHDLEFSFITYLNESPNETSASLAFIDHIYEKQWNTPLTTLPGIDRVFSILTAKNQTSVSLELCSILLKNNLSWNKKKHDYIFQKLLIISQHDRKLLNDKLFNNILLEIVKEDPVSVCLNPAFSSILVPHFDLETKNDLTKQIEEGFISKNIAISDKMTSSTKLMFRYNSNILLDEKTLRNDIDEIVLIVSGLDKLSDETEYAKPIKLIARNLYPIILKIKVINPDLSSKLYNEEILLKKFR